MRGLFKMNEKAQNARMSGCKIQLIIPIFRDQTVISLIIIVPVTVTFVINFRFCLVATFDRAPRHVFRSAFLRLHVVYGKSISGQENGRIIFYLL